MSERSEAHGRPVERTEAFRRLAADSSLVLGGLAALLLQLAHPVVARGVAESSTFARDPLKRLRHTLAFVYAVQIGSAEQRARVVHRVDAAHARVAGARDAEPQLWVAATLAHTGMQVHELLHGPVADGLADEIHTAWGDLGMSLQLPPGAWPADREAFDRYWERTLPTLRVGDDARAVAVQLLAARGPPWWLRPALPAVREFTAVLLPPVVRAAYGLPDRPRRGRAVVRLARVLARITPRRLRELPSRRLLAGLGGLSPAP